MNKKERNITNSYLVYFIFILVNGFSLTVFSQAQENIFRTFPQNFFPELIHNNLIQLGMDYAAVENIAPDFKKNTDFGNIPLTFSEQFTLNESFFSNISILIQKKNVEYIHLIWLSKFRKDTNYEDARRIFLKNLVDNFGKPDKYLLNETPIPNSQHKRISTGLLWEFDNNISILATYLSDQFIESINDKELLGKISYDNLDLLISNSSNFDLTSDNAKLISEWTSSVENIDQNEYFSEYKSIIK